jgi:integrase
MPRHRPLLFAVRFCAKSFRGRHWYVSGFKGEKRVQLWFRSEKEAKAAAANRNAEIKAHGTQVSLSPVNRMQAIAAAEKLAPYGKSILEAVDFFVAHLDRLGSSISVAALCERVGTEFERRLVAKEISTRHASSMRETLKKFSARFGDSPIKLLQGAEVKAWLASQPLAVKTRNRHLGYIRNTFGLAREWNLIEADPFERVNGFNDPHAKTRQVEILTPEQLQAFLNVVDKDFLSFFALSAFSGLRREEIIRLDWSEVKLERNLIDLPFAKSKNRRRKLIEVPENLEAWLSPFVRKSGSLMPRKKLQLAFENAAKAAGIVPWPQNGLRHSFCSYAVALKGFEWTSMQADHSMQMLRKQLLGGGGPGDGGEVLGDPPLKSIPRTRAESNRCALRARSLHALA